MIQLSQWVPSLAKVLPFILKYLKRTPTFLVVEDDAQHARLLEVIIGRLGYKASIATSAEMALGMIELSRYPLVFVDMRLPGKIKGWDLVKELCDASPRTHTVIVLTDPGDLTYVPQSLYFGIIIKPATMKSVQHVILKTRM